MKSFWDKKIIIGQSPMDGVSDGPYRFIMDKYGMPDLLVTEFVPVEAFRYASEKLMDAFVHHVTDTPTLGQIYGTDLDAYYQGTLIVGSLGFDGVDINMGCPDKSVSGRGAGAGLIRTPELAVEIIKTVKRATQDWSNGKDMDQSLISKPIFAWIQNFKDEFYPNLSRKILPVSVKTRMGFDEIVTGEWIKNLCSANPVAITLHGRTLKQMYTGQANWEEIGIAGKVAHDFGIKILGNGDIKSLADAKDKIEKYKLDGVLIGRASFGNPWVYQGREVDIKTKLLTAIEHCEVFSHMLPHGYFPSMRKHLLWYCKGFAHANKVRATLMQSKDFAEVREILSEYI